MPQSLHRIIVHLVFSTKARTPCIDASTLPALHAYLAAVTRSAGCHCYRVGGVADHVHLAIGLSRIVSVSAVVRELKTSSSAWLKSRSLEPSDFAWQRGYGVFSVGPGDLDALIAYIDRQEEHHRTWTFKDEYLAFLAKYDIEYDARYVWD